jgi:hypothetical protein
MTIHEENRWRFYCVFMIIYCDGGGIIGTREGIKEVIETLSKCSRFQQWVKRKICPIPLFNTADIDAVRMQFPRLLKSLK